MLLLTLMPDKHEAIAKRLLTQLSIKTLNWKTASTVTFWSLHRFLATKDSNTQPPLDCYLLTLYLHREIFFFMQLSPSKKAFPKMLNYWFKVVHTNVQTHAQAQYRWVQHANDRTENMICKAGLHDHIQMISVTCPSLALLQLWEQSSFGYCWVKVKKGIIIINYHIIQMKYTDFKSCSPTYPHGIATAHIEKRQRQQRVDVHSKSDSILRDFVYGICELHWSNP